MIKLLQIIITGIFVSFFYFPVEFTFFPGVNTKMMEAVLGLACVALELRRRRSLDIPLELLLLFAAAAGVSLASLVSITINQTPDDSYVSYLISFSVWLSAAFFICSLIKGVHGKIDIKLVLNYLTVVCLAQCVLSLVIDSSPGFSRWVDSYFMVGQEVAHKVKRIYGIGALLDVAGLRFAIVLTSLAFYLAEVLEPLKSVERIFYILSFLAISVIGNMIARTALVGTAIGIVVILAGLYLKPNRAEASKLPALLSWLGLLTVGIIVSVILYNTNPDARKLFRFAFEGFFSLAEKGYWEVTSTEKLKTMVVWPETIHTWIIGDGYFENSRNDINYLGDATDQGYYMGTDVGYLRFIFYFGIVGLIPMMGVIIESAIICIRHFRNERFLFILALAVGLIVWAKVSTDVFLFFALFLSAAALQDKQEAKSSACTSSTT
ncbi:MAG: hypothetical protein IKH11_09730 [Bacteroidales bacterium]|nr:hypothetical protein [Bacteroidales bacterium]